MRRATWFTALLLAAVCAATAEAATVPTGVKVPAWSELNSQQQADLSMFAKRWDRMAASRRVALLERQARWKDMPPPERKMLREGARNFHEMSPELKEKMRTSISAVRKLPEADQRQLRQQWRALDPQQRRAWLELGGPGVASPPNQSDGTIAPQRSK